MRSTTHRRSYLDALVTIDFAAVNTAPANSKAVFLYAYALWTLQHLHYTGSGDTVSSGTKER
jgi:hypothetical protein